MTKNADANSVWCCTTSGCLQVISDEIGVYKHQIMLIKIDHMNYCMGVVTAGVRRRCACDFHDSTSTWGYSRLRQHAASSTLRFT